jgi:hypothetical protein
MAMLAVMEDKPTYAKSTSLTINPKCFAKAVRRGYQQWSLEGDGMSGGGVAQIGVKHGRDDPRQRHAFRGER